MKLLRLIKINMKRQLKNPIIILVTLIMPIGMLLLMNGGTSQDVNKSHLGIINNSQSKEAVKLIEKLGQEYNIEELEGTAEENINKIREKNVVGIYVMTGETGMPKIKSYSEEGAGGNMMADSIIESFSKEIKSTGINENSIKTNIEFDQSKDDTKAVSVVLMICYFMMIGCSVVSEEIIKLKKQKVLRRSISTANTDKQILGGIFISTFLLQGILSSLALIIVNNLIKIENCNVPLGILAIFLINLVSISFLIMAVRWAKNGMLVSTITTVFGLLTFGLGMISTLDGNLENLDFIVKLSVISPFTWVAKILNDGQIVIPIIMIVLMAGVFFTIGSFKLKDFVKE